MTSHAEQLDDVKLQFPKDCDAGRNVHCNCLSEEQTCTCTWEQCTKCTVLCKDAKTKQMLTQDNLPQFDAFRKSVSPQNSCTSESTLSLLSQDTLTNPSSNKSSLDQTINSQSSCSINSSKLSAPFRGHYKKLVSTSITDLYSSTFNDSCDNNVPGHQSGLKSSESFTLFEQTYSQLSTTASVTLTPTPLHPLPGSSFELTSQNESNVLPPIISSPPMSPITPLTNTVTPDDPAMKRAKSKRSIEKAAQTSKYIFIAAHQISLAQEHEKKNELAAAVAKYREGVGTLLQGVQGSPVASTNNIVMSSSSAKLSKGEDEANIARREGVKRKTQQYLHRAELLLARLAKQAAVPGLLSSSNVLNKDLSGAGYETSGLQCGEELLRQYTILGVAPALCCPCSTSTSRVLIAQLPNSTHSVAIKVLLKTGRLSYNGSSMVPRGIAHVVPVICYHETSSAVYVVMKYISGGRLWDHIAKYVCSPVPAPPTPPSLSPSCSPSHAADPVRRLFCGRQLHIDSGFYAEANEERIHSVKKESVLGEDSIKQKFYSEDGDRGKEILVEDDLVADDKKLVPGNAEILCKLPITVEHPCKFIVQEPSEADDVLEPTTISCEFETSMFDVDTSKEVTWFSAENSAVVARSGQARYMPVDTTSCATDSETTLGAECWGESEVLEAPAVTGKQVSFKDNVSVFSEGLLNKRVTEYSDFSDRQTKTSPIACMGRSEIYLCGEDIDFFPGHFVSKSASFDDLTLHCVSGKEEKQDVQHSTISTVDVTPLAPKNKSDEKPLRSAGREEDDNVSVGSDTLSGVSDDFSCSLSVNQQSEEKRTPAASSALNTVGLSYNVDLFSECAVSEGRKRPANTPESSYAFVKRSELCALKSLCQSTSQDITCDVSLDMQSNNTFNDLRVKNSCSGLVQPSEKEESVEKLISLGDSHRSSNKSLSVGSTPRDATDKADKKFAKSKSNELLLEKTFCKTEEEKCPSEQASLSSVTLPSFSASLAAERTASEVASFDIEELIRNSRKLLQNVDLTLEKSKAKSVKPVPSEDSSTSIDQSELPLDSVSVGFDTPDIPSNSTRCSNVSSDNPQQSKVMADNTYSSIPSIALDTDHLLNRTTQTHDSSLSVDKAIRSPRLPVELLPAAVKEEFFAPECEAASNGDSFISCEIDAQVMTKENAFLVLPKESVTSKEDSTNPSDIHTQIHVNTSVEVEDKKPTAKHKGAVLERQANFEKSDTSKSSVPKDNDLLKLIKSLAANGISNNTPSNDSTSVSGITLNNTESGAAPSLNSSSKQSSVDEEAVNEGNCSDVLSTESTSALKYCANPSDDFAVVTDLISNKASGDVKEKPLSEPLYLLPQKERKLIPLGSESSLCPKKKELLAQNENELKLYDLIVLNKSPSDESKVRYAIDLNSKTRAPSQSHKSSHGIFKKESMTEYITANLHPSKSLPDEQTLTFDHKFNEDSFAQQTSHSNSRNGELIPADQKLRHMPRHDNKKTSIMRQTPLAELLEKHYRAAVTDGEAHEKRHLPEGLVKVWGSQIVSAVAALHEVGIIWGDLGPQNLLLGEGGCVLLTLETRWGCVDQQRPIVRHDRNSCWARGCFFMSRDEQKCSTLAHDSRTSTKGTNVYPEASKCSKVELLNANNRSNKITCDSDNSRRDAQLIFKSSVVDSARIETSQSGKSTRSSLPSCHSSLNDGEHRCCFRALCASCLGYVAPELRSPLGVISASCDWWSVGALLYQLLTGQSVADQHPTGFTSHTELRLPNHLSAEAALLLSQLLTAHPSERLGGGPTGAQEIRMHPFFAEVPWPS